MSPRDHSFYQDLLELHISGEPLAPADRLSLFDHIEDCDDCREILEAETRITARMKAVPRLVAPSDLRSKILSQAMRDHRERTTTPIEDPTVADLLRAPAETSTIAPELGTNRGVAPRKSATAPSSAPSHITDDLPVFAGVPRPAPSRLQRTWRKASPALASTFMAVAATTALYFGHFQGIPLAGQAQQLVWATVNSFNEAPATQDSLNTSFAAIATAKLPAPTPSAPTGLPNLKTVPVAPQLRPAPQSMQMVTLVNTPGKPLPGTDAVVAWTTQLREFGVAIDSTVAALSQAATQPVPAPAEKAKPQIAALVLRPTDRDNSTGGFRETELAAALESLAETQPGGRIARQDQFAMDGQRYRLYTLDLPAGCTDRMIKTLTPYKSATDVVIVNALNTQSGANPGRADAVQFYSSNEAHLRSALQTVQPMVSSSGNSERLRVVLVE